MKHLNLERIIGKVEDLPTLPRSILKITELINNPKSSARDLARVISDDHILTARLLRLVNSAFYGFPQRISTVTSAIVLLGFDSIRNLLLTTSIFSLFSDRKKKIKLKREELWDHSIGCAVAAKVIGTYLRYERIEELFVSGLLHDIGKIIEILYLPGNFVKIDSIVEDEGILIINAEERVQGYTHADIGKLLAERWNLPSKIVAVIAHHHEPFRTEIFRKEASIIHFADILCRALSFGSGGDDKIPLIDSNIFDLLGLSFTDIEPIINDIEAEFFHINSSINLS